ncbi:MAG: ADP-ribosylglycohydrolase family protein [Candidatus Levybacteria bacterium]|nr:ADP-ribosylglycohydrolase family protein [Candidatus Levybacteria bacterium]
MPYEFILPYKVRSYFQSHKLEPVETQIFNKSVTGYYTDDTSLAICLAESLIEKGFDTRDQFTKYKMWLREGYATPYGDRAYGVGQQTLKFLTRQSEDNLPTELVNDPKAGGNGALMRCAPIGLLYYKDPKKLIEYSLRSAIVTHNNTIAAWSCVALNSFISYALEGFFKNDYCSALLAEIPDIPTELHNLLNTNLHEINEDELKIRGYSLDTLKVALYAFLTTDTFEDCLTRAIAVGGDTDTQGAVAGALAGAYYGCEVIPKSWRNTLIRHDFIVDLAERLYNSEDLVTKVLYIINGSNRKMPAHFMSNGNRTQSFCVDFDISETDEYEMASKAWRSSTDQSVIKIGEDIMLATFIAVKLDGEEFIPKLYQSITETYPEELFNKHKDYFEHCADFGKLRAKSS